jgi:outer membrane protein assembly factor BamE (lipoprotein component of BamABCDE complex)
MIKISNFLTLYITCLVVAFSMPVTSRADDFKKPVKGMSQKQVRSLYGDPDTVTSSGDGETWTYTKGMGRMFIPFAGAFMHPSILVVMFNNSGRVTTWSLQQQQ